MSTPDPIETAACAHLHVDWDMITKWWACRDCLHHFVPASRLEFEAALLDTAKEIRTIMMLQRDRLADTATVFLKRLEKQAMFDQDLVAYHNLRDAITAAKKDSP